MIDIRVVQAVHAVAREQDTPEVVIDAVLRRLLPSIRLVPQQPKLGEEGRVGGYRIGGCPDLPSGVDWPRLSTAWKLDPEEVSAPNEVLPFLLQINLAEVAAMDVHKALPPTGMLSFYFLWEESGLDEEDVPYITFTKDLSSGLRRSAVPPDLRADRLFRGLELLPCLEWTVPAPADCGLEEEVVNKHLRLWNDLAGRVAEAQGLKDPNSAPTHRLLGHPQFIQSPGLAEGTRLLLQVDSDPPQRLRGQYPETGMTWGDCGRIYYLIGEEELRTHHFDKPWATLEMC